MLKVSFMYDGHTFARIPPWDDKAALIKLATDLFDEDGCGSLFVRDAYDGSLNNLTLHGHRLETGRYGVTPQEVEAWADAVLVERSFQRTSPVFPFLKHHRSPMAMGACSWRHLAVAHAAMVVMGDPVYEQRRADQRAQREEAARQADVRYQRERLADETTELVLRAVRDFLNGEAWLVVETLENGRSKVSFDRKF